MVVNGKKIIIYLNINDLDSENNNLNNKNNGNNQNKDIILIN